MAHLKILGFIIIYIKHRYDNFAFKFPSKDFRSLFYLFNRSYVFCYQVPHKLVSISHLYLIIGYFALYIKLQHSACVFNGYLFKLIQLFFCI
ncbi:hypothetical protein SDC9_161652 [bioreactor metagenome]|uniref:Uncharacterized protein n=1 Tax=bioreactor metagenome TaxID=1076179 RepID=A0A645FKY6_9ZZZZ